ncbi:O-antigen polysaccharide polymerase Wzy [Synechococcus sp. CBW1107]|uniref:O-antigen polysaccharide polymerase Wzy n=1 Tax=Synechococcus sp. CBW1107 TaxID=2789857 RepID=UPI002AD485EB|nr:O-antigen polysaccharide polymerase Wzy [Synechococcus sp. CBW1107]CAK6696870.1 hypothetical protein IFHNHDMJ_02113 [Synechococcus sp. CBW1107]
MNDPTLAVLVLLLGAIVLYHLCSPDPRELFAPPVIVAVVFFFYAVLAPRDAVQTGETNILFLDALPSYPLAWRAVVVHLLGFLVGYHWLRGWLPRMRRSMPVSAAGLARLGYRICVWSTLAYGISAGFGFILQLNPLVARDFAGSSTPLLALGALSNYFSYAINFLTLGIIFQLPAAFQIPSFRFNAYSWILFTAVLYVNFGFRWRLAVLFGAVTILWHLLACRRPSWKLLLTLPLLLVVAGAMGVNRQYGGGIDFEAVSTLNLDELIHPTLTEGKSVFNMTALLIGDVQDRGEYAGFLRPLVATISTLIPRQFLPGKDIADYLRDAFVAVFDHPIAARMGLGVLNVGEYYLIGGWLGVFLIGMLIGYLARLLWAWFRLNSNDPFVASLYTMATAFLYQLISRGFTPGVFILASFTFLPFLLFRRRLRAFLAAGP